MPNDHYEHDHKYAADNDGTCNHNPRDHNVVAVRRSNVVSTALYPQPVSTRPSTVYDWADDHCWPANGYSGPLPGRRPVLGLCDDGKPTVRTNYDRHRGASVLAYANRTTHTNATYDQWITTRNRQ